MRLHISGISAGLLCLSLAGSAVGQAGTEQPQTFRARTELVLVPVTVSKGGEPVRGLTRENFVIEEDGRERPIGVFERVAPEAKPLASRPKSKTFDNLNVDETPRVITLIAIDAINTPFGYQESARKDVLKFLSRNLNPNQMVGLVILRPNGIKIVHDFTSNTESLIRALNKVTSESNRYNVSDSTPTARPGERQDNTRAGEPLVAGGSAADGANLDLSEQFVTTSLQNYLRGEEKLKETQYTETLKLTLDSLQQIAQGLAGYPGRKMLIWASGSFAYPFIDVHNPRLNPLVDQYHHTLKLLADANVVVYPVDVKGIQMVNPGADATVSKFDRAAGVDTSADYRNAGLRMDTFREFAESTGGRVYFEVGHNDKVFKDASEDAQYYYMLGYYLDSSKTEPGWHKLKVRLKNADGKVRTRSGFFVSSATTDPSTMRNTDLAIGSRSPFDYTGLRLTGSWIDPEGAGAKKKVGFQLHIMPENHLIADPSDPKLNIDIVAVARRPDTSVAGQSSRVISTTVKVQDVQVINEQGINYRGALELEPGTYEVRILVRDNQTGRMGSVLTSLTVK